MPWQPLVARERWAFLNCKVRLLQVSDCCRVKSGAKSAITEKRNNHIASLFSDCWLCLWFASKTLSCLQTLAFLLHLAVVKLEKVWCKPERSLDFASVVCLLFMSNFKCLWSKVYANTFQKASFYPDGKRYWFPVCVQISVFDYYFNTSLDQWLPHDRALGLCDWGLIQWSPTINSYSV